MTTDCTLTRGRSTIELGQRLVALIRERQQASARELADAVGTTPRRVRYALAVAHQQGAARLLSFGVSGGRRVGPITRYAIDPATTACREAA